MFSGLIEKTTSIENIIFSAQGAKISFEADFDDVKTGASIALNGVCLTVCKIRGNIIEADVMQETLNISNLKNLKKGDIVNLERALKVNGRLNGHIVTGHIDLCAETKKITQDGFSKRIVLTCDSELIVKKGSIAINGVSLTVSEVFDYGFEVSLIPETINNTNLKNLRVGDIVNIEYDILGKYIQKFIKYPKKSKITFEFLKENGF